MFWKLQDWLLDIIGWKLPSGAWVQSPVVRIERCGFQFDPPSSRVRRYYREATGKDWD